MEAYQLLEEEWAKWNKLDPVNVVACNSGTAALHLALEALQLPEGSGVLVPDYTFIACARAVTMAGLTPIFIDCNEGLLIDLDKVDEYCRPHLGQRYGRGGKTGPTGPGAIMPVHVYGRCVDMKKVIQLATKYDLYVIEDLAEAHSITPHPDSDAACWSFYKNKVVAGEEGGAIAFRCEEEANVARCLRSQGFTDAHDFNHYPRGYNYRLANTLADLIRHSLKRVDINLVRRRQIEGQYDIRCPSCWRMPRRDVPWVYDLRIPGLSAEQQNTIIHRLREKGIEARHGFKSCSMQQEYYGRSAVVNHNAIKASREVVYLPIVPTDNLTPAIGTTEDQIRLAFDVIGTVLSVSVERI